MIGSVCMARSRRRAMLRVSGRSRNVPIRSVRQNDRRGVATVELAITLPLFVLLTFGVLEVTNLIYLKQSLKICAYEGARVALLPDTRAANVELACQKLLAVRGVKNATVQVTPSAYPFFPYGTPIVVRISARLSDNLISPPFVLSDRTVTARVVMMKEQ